MSITDEVLAANESYAKSFNLGHTGRVSSAKPQGLASLNHPNMELVEGAGLEGPAPIDTAVAYARQGHQRTRLLLP
jgi:hypothetical protein